MPLIVSAVSPVFVSKIMPDLCPLTFKVPKLKEFGRSFTVPLLIVIFALADLELSGTPVIPLFWLPNERGFWVGKAGCRIILSVRYDGTSGVRETCCCRTRNTGTSVQSVGVQRFAVRQEKPFLRSTSYC